MRVVEISSPSELRRLMRRIKVDPYGIKIMLPKGITHLIKMNSVSNIAANILKQEMLSLGADVALARDAITGRLEKTDCLLMGNAAQLKRLNQKLHKQPFGLDRLACGLSQALRDYQKDEFVIDLGRFKLNLGAHTRIMGIINLTPDSFSGDGLPPSSEILDYAQKMVADGADIIDIGGESSRPGAKAVSLKEELKRVIPALNLLAKRIKVPISVDTYKPEVARQALDNGASLINDITGLRNRLMIKVIAKYGAGVVIMHMKGRPRTMQVNPAYGSLIDEIIDYLRKAIERAVELGVDRDKIIIDPGIGFGKSLEHNLEILRGLKEFKALGRPMLVGPSRKSFIGKLLNTGPKERVFGTLSACLAAKEKGAKILRVHDVKETRQALKITEAIERVC